MRSKEFPDKNLPQHLKKDFEVMVEEETFDGRIQFFTYVEGDRRKFVVDPKTNQRANLKLMHGARVVMQPLQAHERVVFCKPLLVVADASGDHPLVSAARMLVGHRITVSPTTRGGFLLDGGLAKLSMELTRMTEQSSEDSQRSRLVVEQLLTIETLARSRITIEVSNNQWVEESDRLTCYGRWSAEGVRVILRKF